MSRELGDEVQPKRVRISRNQSEALQHTILNSLLVGMMPLWGSWLVLNVLLSQGLDLSFFVRSGKLYIYSVVLCTSTVYVLWKERGRSISNDAGLTVVFVLAILAIFISTLFFTGLLIAGQPVVNIPLDNGILISTSIALCAASLIFSYISQVVANSQPINVMNVTRQAQVELNKEFDELDV